MGKTDEDEIKTPYINIQTDFGFKEVFGQEKNKKALIRFLNILFEGKLTVRDIVYHDKEVLPAEKDGKRIVYDVYATSPTKKSESGYFPTGQKKPGRGKDDDSDHHFILEMQNIYTPPYEERIVYYASKMVAGQGKAGWEYELAPVFAIAVTDFNFKHLRPKLIRDIMYMDRETAEELTDKVHIIVCSLKEVPEKWEDCRTEMEEVLFLIKNMEDMDNTSLAYTEGRYADIFEAARSNRLRGKDVIDYSKSLEKLRDIQKGIRYAIEEASEEAREKGLAEGREKGLAEGLEKGLAEGHEKGLSEGLEKGLAEGRVEGRAEGEEMERMKSIRMMLAFGIPAEKIAEQYHLSSEEILRIANMN